MIATHESNGRPLLRAFKQGKGVVTCSIPTYGCRDSHDFLLVTIRVGSGSICAIRADGEAVENLKNVSIPLSAIKNNRVTEETSLDPDKQEIYQLRVRLYGFLKRAARWEHGQFIHRERKKLASCATIKPKQFFRGRTGVAVLELAEWDEHEWRKDENGSYSKGKFLKKHNDVQFAVERNERGEIRLAACLPWQEKLFPEKYRTFGAAQTVLSGTMMPKPYDNLGIFGAMLRMAYYETVGAAGYAARLQRRK